MLGILTGGLLTFAFGGALLILFLGARRIEDGLNERDREASELPGAPRFLRAALGRGASEEALLSELRVYLEEEQIAADEFVWEPSMERLYRQSGEQLMGR